MRRCCSTGCAGPLPGHRAGARVAAAAGAVLGHGAGLAGRHLPLRRDRHRLSCACAPPPAHAGCRANCSRWIARRRSLQLGDGATLDYDLLSLNVGSTLHPPPADRGHRAVDAPAGEAARGLGRRCCGAGNWTATMRPSRVTAVGGGAAGFESLLAALARLRALRPQRRVQGRLLTRGSSLLPGLAPAAVRAAQRALAQAGVSVQLGTAWSEAIAARSDLRAVGHRRRGARLAGRCAAPWWPGGQRARLHPRRRDAALGVAPAGVRGGRLRRMGAAAAQGRRVRGAHGPGARPQPARRARRQGTPHRLRAAAPLPGAAGHRRRPRHRLARALRRRGRWVWRWKDHIDRGFVGRFATPALRPPET